MQDKERKKNYKNEGREIDMERKISNNFGALAESEIEEEITNAQTAEEQTSNDRGLTGAQNSGLPKSGSPKLLENNNHLRSHLKS